jgi:hypothetical protein
MSLQERVTRILKQPQTEWPVIEAESTSVGTLYRSYIMPLAAIPAICGFLGMVLIGVSLPVVGGFRYGIAEALRVEVFRFVSQLIVCYIAAYVVSMLARTFNSRDDVVQALKLVAYSMTPVWIAGVLYLIPALAVLVLLAGLYGIYLFYLGVPVLMKSPADKVVPYMIVSVVVIIVIWFVLAAVLSLAGGAARVGGII